MPIKDNLTSAASDTLSDHVYRGIYEAITLGEWPAGTKLPTEYELTKKFGVSRTVIREALIRLRIDGLVRSRQGAGTRVISAPKKAVLEFTEPENISDIQRCYEFRIGVEGEAAYLAAQRQSRERIADIASALERMVESYDKPEGLSVEEDMDFHIAIALATENSFYIRTIKSGMQSFIVGMRIARSFSRGSTKEYQLPAVNEHRVVYESIVSGDAIGAREAMRQHIEGTRRRVFVGL